MYVYYNANPSGKATGDCVIRAISTITGLPWRSVHWNLAALSNEMYQMMDDNVVWHEYLRRLGFDIHTVQLPCTRAKDFGNMMNFMNQFNQFRQGVQGNPQQMVQNMIQNGQMSQDQFHQLSNMANQIMPFMKR